MYKHVGEYIRQNWVNTVKPACESHDTLIALPYPYTTPCISGMFQELYYWDTYFTNVGLLLSGMTAQAKHNIDNMLHLVRTYGKMPNGNRTYYLNRSQPPFLSQMVRELFEVTNDTAWLAEEAYPALMLEYRFWQEHRAADGLNRYGCDLTNDADYIDIAAYFSERISQPLPSDDATRIAWGKSMMALAESGWDCTSRFALNAHEYAPADLNSLLYLLETNMAYFASVLSKDDEEAMWKQRAAHRREMMHHRLWSDSRQVFCDRHLPTGTLNHMVSAAAFYPLYAGAATAEQAAATVKAALPLLEHEHGIACCEKREDLLDLQWDHPHGWACLHFIVIKGLLRYGFREDALRVAFKFVRTVATDFDATGHLWEKYNVVDGTVSATLEYDTPPMMGWTAGVYLYCEQLLKDNT